MRLVCVLLTFENDTGLKDLRTDTASYRDATAHLKIWVEKTEARRDGEKYREMKMSENSGEDLDRFFQSEGQKSSLVLGRCDRRLQ